MFLIEPYNSWLIKNIGANIDANTRFITKVAAVVGENKVDMTINLDLIWFILLKQTDDRKTMIDVVTELLKQPEFLQQFKNTLSIQSAKRLIAEYLLLNDDILRILLPYIDFSTLDIPINFVSHALFIKLSNDPDNVVLDQKKFEIVNMVLDTGFQLIGENAHKSTDVVLHKVLLMQIGDARFALAKRLINLGFQLFCQNMTINAEVAVSLLNNRDNQNCLDIIKNNITELNALKFPNVGGNPDANIADYYYWVKEDMLAVKFIREVLKLDLTP